MKLRHILTLSLMLMAAVSAAVIATLLIKHYTGEELKTLSSSLQIVIFIFTASAGLLALIKYWNSVEADLEHKQWEKLHHLQDSFDQFRDRNLSVIQAFEWPHILRSQYLHLCDKALQYDKADDDIQTSLLTLDELTCIRELDDFLEYFENLYFATSRKLVKVDDILIFLQYYIMLLGDAYHNPNDIRLKRYLDEYYYNVQSLLANVANELTKHPERWKNKSFLYYPRIKVPDAYQST